MTSQRLRVRGSPSRTRGPGAAGWPRTHNYTTTQQHDYTPSSPAAPCTDRLHPGPETPSGRICPARTCPTWSSLGGFRARDASRGRGTYSGAAGGSSGRLGGSSGRLGGSSREAAPGSTRAAPAAGRQGSALIGPKFVTRSYLYCLIRSASRPGLRLEEGRRSGGALEDSEVY